jgi:NAD-dependent dihydropyrimidine dehydrogenase PreA subunit
LNSNSVTLKIFRFDPDKDVTPRYKTYEVPYSDGMTVHIALKHIYENLDNTLAFKDSCCYSLQCYGCLVRLDGKPVRACASPVSPDKTYTIEPVSAQAVIRDLAVNFKSRVATVSFKNLYSAVISTNLCTACGSCADACPHKFIQLIGDNPVIKTMVRQDWCPVGDTIECGECVKACPVYEAGQV